MPIWRSALCFVFGVALIVSAVWSPAVILSGDRAVFILVAWVVIGAYLIVRAYTSRLRVTKEHEPDQQYGTSVSLNRALSRRHSSR